MTVPESTEVRDEQFWRDGGGFRWCWPLLDITTPADKRPRAMLNRYPHNIIGAAVVAFGRCWGIRWKISGTRRQARVVKLVAREAKRDRLKRERAYAVRRASKER